MYHSNKLMLFTLTVAAFLSSLSTSPYTLVYAHDTQPTSSDPAAASKSKSLTGKLMFGYQGWFDAAESGSPRNTWVHWSSGTPSSDTVTFDLWPDMAEYTDTFETAELLSRNTDTQPMSLFSSWSASTTALHFQWMSDYNIDGVFVQRFVCELSNDGNNNIQGDDILSNAIKSAEATGRTVTIMYDISGASEDTWAADILRDWTHIIEDLNATASPSWQHHNDNPVIAVWGLGFTDHPGTAESSLQFLSDLRDVRNVTIVGGVPTHWRTSDGDSKPGYKNFYDALDVVSPWLVGRFSDEASFDSYFNNVFLQDASQLKEMGSGYAPVVFPGFSWSNLMRNTGQGDDVINAIPRNGGKFWLHQAESFADMEDAPLFIYGAMFDEVDEGTAMFKVVSHKDDTPAGPAEFLYLSVDGDDIPSDFYLELAGNFTGWMERDGQNEYDRSEYAGKRESDSKQSWSEEERLDHLDQAKELSSKKSRALKWKLEKREGAKVTL